MQWHMQSGIIITNLKVKVDFTLPEISVMKIMTGNFHVNESAKVTYDMILGRNL